MTRADASTFAKMWRFLLTSGRCPFRFATMFRLGVHFAGMLFRMRASAICALCVALLLAACAGRAQATCGDYLQMDDNHAQADHAPNPRDDAPPVNAPCGCRGMECGGAPIAPIAPKAPLRTHSQQDGSLLHIADRSLTLHASWTRTVSDARPNRGYPLRLNRPPSARV